jgi:hypothetical protein
VLDNNKSSKNLNYLNNINSYNNTNNFENNIDKKVFNNNFNNLNFFKNKDLTYNFIDLKSNNKSILPSDRNIRSLDNFGENLNTKNIKDSNSVIDKLSTLNTSFMLSNTPTNLLSQNNLNYSYDKFGEDNSTSNILRSKEESAPNFIFNTY